MGGRTEKEAKGCQIKSGKVKRIARRKDMCEMGQGREKRKDKREMGDGR